MKKRPRKKKIKKYQSDYNLKILEFSETIHNWLEEMKIKFYPHDELKEYIDHLETLLELKKYIYIHSNLEDQLFAS